MAKSPNEDGERDRSDDLSAPHRTGGDRDRGATGVGSLDRLAGRRVLVTGGGGFIGSNLVEALATRADVTVLDDFSSGSRRNLEGIADASIIAGDVCDRDTVEAAVRNQDVVAHMAAVAGVQRTIDNPIETLEINVEGTRTVLDAAIDAGVDRVLFASTSEMYGDSMTPPYEENGPISPKTNYAVAKAVNERYVKAYCERSNVSYSIVRYFNVYGPNQNGADDGYVVPKFVRLALANDPIPVYGSGEQTRDFTYIDDAVDATIRALGPAGRNESFNVGTGVESSIHSLATQVADVVGSGRVERIEDPRPYRVERRCADITRARAVLGYEPSVPLRDGIRRIARAMGRNRSTPTSGRGV